MYKIAQSERPQAFSHLVFSVGENGILGVHQDSAGFLLHSVERGRFHGDVSGFNIAV